MFFNLQDAAWLMYPELEMQLTGVQVISFLPRTVSESNNTILQVKPLNQPGCCLGEFVTFFSSDSQKYALPFCWESFLVLFCPHSSSLIPSFELFRHCPSTWDKQRLFAACLAASFLALSLWLRTRFKVMFPGVSWALVFFLSTAHHLCPCHLSDAMMPSPLPLLIRYHFQPPLPLTQSKEHPLA